MSILWQGLVFFVHGAAEVFGAIGMADLVLRPGPGDHEELVRGVRAARGGFRVLLQLSRAQRLCICNNTRRPNRVDSRQPQ